MPLKKWYTRHAEVAINLKDYCDESALKALENENALNESSAYYAEPSKGREYFPSYQIRSVRPRRGRRGCLR